MIKRPCPIECEKRTATCHSDCIDYIFFEAANELDREKRYKESQMMSGYIEYNINRGEKRRNKKWR